MGESGWGEWGVLLSVPPNITHPTVIYLLPGLLPGPIVVVPDFLLWIAVAGYAVTQVFTLYAARWVIKKARNESVTQKDDVTEHFDERLENVEGRLEGQLESFEGRFAEAYKKDMEALPDAIAVQVKMRGMSEKGAESRALQAYLDKEGVEVDQAIETAEGQFFQDNPRALAGMALKKAYDADVSDKYRKENPIKAFIFDAGKGMLLPQLEQAFMGSNTLSPARKQGNTTNPYGL